MFSRCRGNMSTELFPSNGCCTVACSHSCYLAIGLHVTILWLSGLVVALFSPALPCKNGDSYKKQTVYARLLSTGMWRRVAGLRVTAHIARWQSTALRTPDFVKIWKMATLYSSWRVFSICSVTPRSLVEVSWRYGRIQCLHLHGGTASQVTRLPLAWITLRP
jgi:hypothetical protein